MVEFLKDSFTLIQYVALLLVGFYILFQSKLFYRLNTEEKKRKNTARTWLIIAVFGLFSLLATESSIHKFGAFGNVRDLAPIAAGFIGGPLPGLGAGFIGAVYRLFQGGVSCVPCSLATLLSGLSSGIYYLIRKRKFISPLEGFVFAVIYESFHVGLVVVFGFIYEVFNLGYLFASENPFNDSLQIAVNLGPPMILANALGLFLFSFLIKQYSMQQKRRAAQQKIENEIEVVSSLQTNILPTLSSETGGTFKEKESFTKLKPYMITEHFDKGHILFNKNDNADKIYYISEGFIRLMEINKVVGHPELIGETGILTPAHKRTMSAVCETNLKVYTIDSKNIIRAIHEIPSLLFDLILLSLKRYTVNLTESISEKERIASELKVAESIQACMLPRKFPPFPERKEIDIYAHMEPAKEVGGDFFDFFFTCNNKIFFTIADVSGKSIPGALFMVIAKTLLKTEAMRCISPGEVLKRVNGILFPDNDECMFVTVFCAVLDTNTGELEYSNAGHNPPLVCTMKNNFDFITVKSNFVLAAMNNVNYETEKMKLSPGDIFFLYTDGVTEAMNMEKKQFSGSRLKETLAGLKGKSVKEIIQGVKQEVKIFSGDEPQSDDITMLVLKYNGKL